MVESLISLGWELTKYFSVPIFTIIMGIYIYRKGSKEKTCKG